MKNRPPDPDAVERLRLRSRAGTEAVKKSLRIAIRTSGLSDREITRRLGNSPAYLANLLGPVKGRDPAGLRLDTCLGLLDILGLNAQDFLSQALADQGQEASEPASREKNARSVVAALELELGALAQENNSLPRADARALVEAALQLVKTVSAALVGSGARPG
jgi:hypothetical protein